MLFLHPAGACCQLTELVVSCYLFAFSFTTWKCSHDTSRQTFQRWITICWLTFLNISSCLKNGSQMKWQCYKFSFPLWVLLQHLNILIRRLAGERFLFKNCFLTSFFFLSNEWANEWNNLKWKKRNMTSYDLLDHYCTWKQHWHLLAYAAVFDTTSWPVLPAACVNHVCLVIIGLRSNFDISG